MGFNRFEAKMAAKNSMRQAHPHPMLVALVFVLLTGVLTSIVLNLVNNPWSEAMGYLARGYDPEEVFRYVFLRGTGRIGIFFVLELLLNLYTTVMGFGYTSYSLRLARNEQPGYRNLFDGFARVGRVLWMNILTAVFTGLWMMIGLVPGGIVMVIGAVNESSGLLILGWLLYMAGMIVGLVMSYRYRLAAYFLLDDPACTARESIRRSKAAMRGWKGELFVLDMSFLGWIILGMFTLGILYLWLNPYMGATEANFYDFVTSANRPSGGYIGPVYDSDPGSGPQPF